jgi:hypothetical protein
LLACAEYFIIIPISNPIFGTSTGNGTYEILAGSIEVDAQNMSSIKKDGITAGKGSRIGIRDHCSKWKRDQNHCMKGKRGRDHCSRY